MSSENPDIEPDDGDEMSELGKGFADMSIAITHGNYFADGGGERVANELARAFDAPLYYGFGNPEHRPDDIEAYSHGVTNELDNHTLFVS